MTPRLPETILPVCCRGLLLTLLVVMSGCAATNGIDPDWHANHVAPVARDAADCARLLIREEPEPVPQAPASAGELSISVWNVAKGQGPQWERELAALAAAHDMVLLQEFALSDPDHEHGYLSFAPGYLKAGTATGVAVLSRSRPLARCELSAREPLLRTPKATAIVELPLADGRSLIVVNLHAVNFALGLKNFTTQIHDAVAAVAAHRGPLIFTGDFNTWRPQRQLLLEQALDGLGLVEVAFTEDVRKRVFGLPLDRVYVRDLHVLEATSRPVSSSDHNPLFVRLRG